MKPLPFLCVVLLCVAGCDSKPKSLSREVIFPEHPTNAELLAAAKGGSKEAQQTLVARAERQQKALKDSGIVISQADLQADIDATVKKEFAGNREAFAKVLSEGGYTLETYAQTRRKILAMQKLRDLIAKKEL